MSDKLIHTYKKHTRKRWFFVLGTFLVLVIVAHFAVLSGAMQITFQDLVNIIWSGKIDDTIWQVVLKIRLPRVLGAIIAGLALSVSGSVIQSLLRNPLASPFTLGISSASAFGAAFAIVVLGAGSSYAGSNDVASITNPYLVTGSAFLWSLASVFVILLLSKYRGATPEIIILSGIIISSLFGAGISAMQYFSDNVQLAAIVFWTFGDIGRAAWNDLFILTILIIPATLFFLWKSWDYKSLQAGDEYAKSLGINPVTTRLIGMIIASLITASVVSFYGIIAFVGLVVPHIVRRMIGGDELFMIPASALFGGLFLLLSDTLARTVISPVVLPVGILTSFLGAPLFLFLLIKGIGKGYWK
jgi:iron complex transport system permease protein